MSAIEWILGWAFGITIANTIWIFVLIRQKNELKARVDRITRIQDAHGHYE